MTNRLQQTHRFLTQHLLRDPQLCLAITVATFDPLWQMSDEDWDYQPEYVLPFALHMIRRVFPCVYGDAIQALQHGETQAMVEQLICDGITGVGIPVDEIEWLLYGIPIPALEDPNFIRTQPDLEPVLSCFGIQANQPDVTVPAYTYTTAYHLAESLQQQAEEHLKQVGWLMGHLFSCTGNSTVDWSIEDMDGIEWLAWDKDNVAFAIALIEEADDILTQATEGLAWCYDHPDFLRILERNFQQTYIEVKKVKGKTDDLQLELDRHTATGCHL